MKKRPPMRRGTARDGTNPAAENRGRPFLRPRFQALHGADASHCRERRARNEATARQAQELLRVMAAVAYRPERTLQASPPMSAAAISHPR